MPTYPFSKLCITFSGPQHLYLIVLDGSYSAVIAFCIFDKLFNERLKARRQSVYFRDEVYCPISRVMLILKIKWKQMFEIPVRVRVAFEYFESLRDYAAERFESQLFD